MTYTTAAAEDLALQGLLFIAGHDELAALLLASSGVEPDRLRQAAADPDFLRHVLDFLCEDDQRILEFAAERAIRPQEVMAARTALSGPGSYGWEPD